MRFASNCSKQDVLWTMEYLLITSATDAKSAIHVGIGWVVNIVLRTSKLLPKVAKRINIFPLYIMKIFCLFDLNIYYGVKTCRFNIQAHKMLCI